MIKNCKILINNEYVTVIDFDGKQIQLPSIKRRAKFVTVKFSDGKYTVLPDDYIEQKVDKGATIVAEAGDAIAVVEDNKPKQKKKTKKATEASVKE